MTMRDHLGLAMSGADTNSLACYQSALATSSVTSATRWPSLTMPWRSARSCSWPTC